MSPENALTLEDVSYTYGGPPVLEHVSLDIPRGEFLGLVGPNGGGKSTLLKVMMGLLKPTGGRATLLGRPPAQGRQGVGYVPQYAPFSRDFPISVEDTVLLGRLGKVRGVGGYGPRDREVARRAMEEAHILALRGRRLATLSGGQLQRVLFARALACEPQILMLDEPTSNIDMRAETDVFELLKQFSARMTIIVVSHDIGFISQYVTRVACLNRTLICHQTDAITGETIDELYGAPMRMIHHVH